MSQTMMTAIAIEGGKGAAEALKSVQMPVPAPATGEILIRVRAAGVNRPDIVQRLGFYPAPPGAPETLGLEVAGEVVTAAGRWKAGDRVCALLGGGGYAEYAVVDARHALPIPEGMSFEQAAGLPETVFTVYANVFEHGALKAGETLMIHGATSGIGVTAIQMAKAAGAKVIATGRGADKKAQALSLGADVAVDVTTEDFEAVAKEAGGSLSKCVKMTLFLTDMAQFPVVNAVMERYISQPYPARSTVAVSALPRGAAFEVEAVMVLD